MNVRMRKKIKTRPPPHPFYKNFEIQPGFRDFTADFTGFQDFRSDFGKDFRDFGISRKISEFAGDFRISFEISAEEYEISVAKWLSPGSYTARYGSEIYKFIIVTG